MTVTASSAQARIVLLVGDVDPASGAPPSPASNGVLAANIATLWDYHAASDEVAPGLRSLYVERDAIDLVLAVLRRQYDITTGSLRVQRSQQATTLAARLKSLDERIVLVLRAHGAGVAASGAITRTAPVTPDDAAIIPTVLDANDPRLSGSPYRPIWPSGRS